MEFSIGIHYMHSAFPHWSNTRRRKISSERYCVSELENNISLEMLALHKNILERENIHFRKKEKEKINQ